MFKSQGPRLSAFNIGKMLVPKVGDGDGRVLVPVYKIKVTEEGEGG